MAPLNFLSSHCATFNLIRFYKISWLFFGPISLMFYWPRLRFLYRYRLKCLLFGRAASWFLIFLKGTYLFFLFFSILDVFLSINFVILQHLLSSSTSFLSWIFSLRFSIYFNNFWVSKHYYQHQMNFQVILEASIFGIIFFIL